MTLPRTEIERIRALAVRNRGTTVTLVAETIMALCDAFLWRPIETIPACEEVLLLLRGGIVIGDFETNRLSQWMTDGGNPILTKPLAWQPLPPRSGLPTCDLAAKANPEPAQAQVSDPFADKYQEAAPPSDASGVRAGLR